jgi:hypothetical protein
MKSILTTLLILFVYSLTIAQNDYDSLEKYSYYIDGNNINNADLVNKYELAEGTGFYINRHHHKYFITAKHVISGCDYNGNQSVRYIDTMMIFYNDSNGLKIYKPWHIGIQELIKSHLCAPAYLYADTISVLKSDTNSVYCINNLANEITPEKTNGIIVFGFPLSNNISEGGYTIKPASKIISFNYELNTNVSISDSLGNTYIDSLNYYIKLKDFVVGNTLEGFSGAPVFVKNTDSNKWYLLGMMIAINTHANLICVIKSKYLF